MRELKLEELDLVTGGVDEATSDAPDLRWPCFPPPGMAATSVPTDPPPTE